MPLSQSTSPKFPPEDEVIFLTLHHLHTYDSNPAVAKALQTLENALTDIRKLPTVNDYTGAEHSLTYEQCADRFRHIPPAYLCDLLGTRLDFPRHSQSTLLSQDCFQSSIHRRCRGRLLNCTRSRRLPYINTNIYSLLTQYEYLSMPVPIRQFTRSLLPTAFRPVKRLVGHHLPVFTTIFDHSSRYIITGSDDHLIKVWSAESACLLYTLRGHDGNIIEVVRHPTRPIIVSASCDSTLRVWDLLTGAALHVLDGGSREVNALQFSPCPDRPYLVSGGADGSIRLWNADDFNAGSMRIPIPQRLIMRHATDTRHPSTSSPPQASTSAAVPSSPRVDFSTPPLSSPPPSDSAHPSEQTCSMDVVCPLLNTMQSNNRSDSTPSTVQPVVSALQAPRTTSSTAHPVQPFTETGINPVSQTQSLPTNSPSQSRSRLTDNALPNGHANSLVSGTPLNEVLSVCFNAGATRLAVGGSDCHAYIFAIDIPKVIGSGNVFPKIRHLTTLRGHSDSIIQVLFSHVGDDLITASRDGTARVWRRTKARLPAGKRAKEDVIGMGVWSSTVLDCRAHQHADTRSAFSGAASGSASGSIIPRVRRVPVPVSLCAVMWSFDDRCILTSSSDAKIRIWNSVTGQLVRVLDGHEQEMYAMQFHPLNDDILLTGGYDGKCIFWDLTSGKQLHTLFIGDDFNTDSVATGPSQEENSKRPSICDGQFAPNGLSFVVSDTSGAVTIFGTSSGEETALAPREQFFATEHTPIRRDPQNRVIHELTGRLMHLEPPGLLCDRNFNPHPTELQPNPIISVMQEKSDSESAVQDRRESDEGSSSQLLYETLMAKAKEFRSNEEREERRLLREAKLARRRVLMEREKKILRKDAQPQYLASNDFAVPDSDFVDSDMDFNANEAALDVSKSSSSSGEDSDEIRPLRKGGRKSKGFSSHQPTCNLRSTKKGRRLRKARQKASLNRTSMVESGDDDPQNDIDNESPAYEVESHDSDSDDSHLSKDPSREKMYSKDGKGATLTPNGKSTLFATYGIERASAAPIYSEVVNLGRSLSPAHSQAPYTPSPTLVGASIVTGQKRMKFSTSTENPENRTQSMSSNPAHLQLSGQTSERGQDNGNMRVGSNNAIATHVQNRLCVTPSVLQRTSQVEDQQDDTASCFGSKSLTETLREDRGAGGSVDGVRQHSTTYASVNPEHLEEPQLYQQFSLTTGIGSGAREDRGLENNEKSLLSDSPGDLGEAKWQTRTRSQSLNDNVIVNGLVPTVDIDEIAEREVEILDAQRLKRRKRGKVRMSPSESGGEISSDECGDGHDGHDSSEGGKRLRKRRNSKANAFVKERSMLEVGGGKRTLETSSWLRTSNNRYTYVPQVEDEVMYFAEGHITAVNIARENGFEPLLDKASFRRLGKEVLDGTVIGKECQPLRFQIVDVAYQFPTAPLKPRTAGTKAKVSRANADALICRSKTVMVLNLRLLGGLKRKAGQTEEFVLSYFPVDAPDYLVLAGRVESAMLRSWKPKDRFRILFLNENRAWQYYTGTVRNVKSTMQRLMWNTIEVEYDNEGEFDKGSTDLVSPWELEPFDDPHSSKDLAAASLQMSSGRKVTVEPGLFPFIARELDAIRSTEISWRAKLSWMDTVDALAMIAGYCDTVPCPLDLSIILVRLCTSYYRHFNSFLHDVMLIRKNACCFYGEQSEIGTLTIAICHQIIEMARKIREQFIFSISPYNQNSHLTGTHLNSREMCIRSSPSELSNAGMAGYGHASHAMGSKPFVTAMTPQSGVQAAPNGTAVMGNMLDASASGTCQQRVRNGVRIYGGNQPNSNHTAMMYSNQLGGMRSLPPALPVMTNGVSTKSWRGGRGGPRAKGSRHQNNDSVNRGTPGMTEFPIQAEGSPTMSVSAAAETVPMRSQERAQNQSGQDLVQNGAVSRIRKSPASYMQTATPTPVRSGGDRDAPIGSSSKHAPITSTVSCAMSVPFNGVTASNGIASPPPDGIVTAGTVSATKQSAPGATTGSRGITSNGWGGDGGAHSWSRSMEAAGGIFPLQASTSDSHLVARHGQAQSPISPIGRVDGNNGSMRNTNPGTYHEHSTVSMAAAESTMSCGGVEVALQAASAESIDMMTSSRNASEGRKVR